jgi:hypothetical protein
MDKEPSYPKEYLYYTAEQIATVIDMITKIGDFVKTKGFDLETLLKEKGTFLAIPTVAELKENKNNIAAALEDDLWAIYNRIKL